MQGSSALGPVGLARRPGGWSAQAPALWCQLGWEEGSAKTGLWGRTESDATEATQQQQQQQDKGIGHTSSVRKISILT